MLFASRGVYQERLRKTYTGPSRRIVLMKSVWLPIVILTIAAQSPAQTLTGAIDMHAHSDPDGSARSIDAIDLARMARDRGMRAIVLKNHYEPTASLAWIARKEVPGLEVFGGISLDLTVGGVNPAAVEWMTKVKGGYGRVVWMPTFDSEHQVTASGQHRPFARVAKDGRLVPEVVEVISIVARNHLVLETGHSSPAEALLLIREARRQGVENILVTHAMNPLVGMSLSEMQEAARLGAYIEFVWVKPGSEEAKQYAKAIREVGPEFCVLSSDLGQPSNPLHPDGLLAFYQYLRDQGFSLTEIDRMAKVNPAKLLGLKP
jgi:hypothetical protein